MKDLYIGQQVISVTNVTVTLGWVPNMAGGIPESYTVRYKIASTLDYQVSTHKEPLTHL